MMGCRYCGRPLEEGEGRTHGACDVEFDKRLDAGKCVRCSGPKSDSGTYACWECWNAGASYVGYPPEGA